VGGGDGEEVLEVAQEGMRLGRTSERFDDLRVVVLQGGMVAGHEEDDEARTTRRYVNGPVEGDEPQNVAVAQERAA